MDESPLMHGRGPRKYVETPLKIWCRHLGIQREQATTRWLKKRQEECGRLMRANMQDLSRSWSRNYIKGYPQGWKKEMGPWPWKERITRASTDWFVSLSLTSNKMLFAMFRLLFLSRAPWGAAFCAFLSFYSKTKRMRLAQRKEWNSNARARGLWTCNRIKFLFYHNESI